MPKGLFEMIIGLVIYTAGLFASSGLLPIFDHTVLRTAVALLPVPGAIIVMWAVVRHLGRIDEMQRRAALEGLAMAFSGSALFAISYGFLEGVGFPKLSAFVMWGVMGGLWFVGSLLSSFRYR